jgi:phosphatidylglycerol:prolipoprotein diacylglycerol transferase
MLVHPEIDPVAIALGPVKIHWYGLMYVLGIAGGWWVARRRAAAPGSTWKAVDVDDLIFFAAIGVIAGGRIGWILFYGFDAVREDWLAIIKVWNGGMSFHGGLIGVLLAITWFAHRRGRRIVDVFDFTAPLPAIGLGAGRIGNFINGELWGKPTDLPWGFLYHGEVRHPSQLYEAGLEGLVLFALLWWFTSRPRPALAPSGLFLVAYGTFRFLIEFVRVPDANLGYLALVAGLGMLAWAYRYRRPSGNYA